MSVHSGQLEQLSPEQLRFLSARNKNATLFWIECGSCNGGAEGPGKTGDNLSHFLEGGQVRLLWHPSLSETSPKEAEIIDRILAAEEKLSIPHGTPLELDGFNRPMTVGPCLLERVNTCCATRTIEIAIVDNPRHEHGRMVETFAQVKDFRPKIRWIEPSLNLPTELAAVRGVAAVAVPIGVRGATTQDRFTQQMWKSIRILMHSGIPVFVAAGTMRPNLLSRAGIAVSTNDVPGSASTSEACVRAAAQLAFEVSQQNAQ